MNNQSLILTLEDQIKILFKRKTAEMVNQGTAPSFSDLAHWMESEEKIKLEGALLCELQDWHSKVHELSWLDDAINDGTNNEIIVFSNTRAQSQGREKNNFKITGLSPDDYQLSLETLASMNHIKWNYKDCFASFFVQLSGHLFRASLCHYSAGPGKKSSLYLRRIRNKVLPLESFSEDINCREIVRELVEKKKNVIVCGATGSGKTTLLRNMLESIPDDDHVIILEDTHEIKLDRKHVTHLLASEEEGKALVDYCSYALRMSPERIIIGEMRSSEVIPFLLNMNTGHKGIMSTLHANSSIDALSRLCLLFSLYQNNSKLEYSLILKLICQGLDAIIFVANKKITEVVTVLGCERETPYFEYLYRSCEKDREDPQQKF